jgi:formylmethanofuran dehydrogenase subunit E
MSSKDRIENNYSFCEGCGELPANTPTYTVAGGIWCYRCADSLTPDDLHLQDEEEIE